MHNTDAGNCVDVEVSQAPTSNLLLFFHIGSQLHTAPTFLQTHTWTVSPLHQADEASDSFFDYPMTISRCLFPMSTILGVLINLWKDLIPVSSGSVFMAGTCEVEVITNNKVKTYMPITLL